MKKSAKIAVVQEPPVYLNCDLSIKKMEGILKKAAGEGSALIVFPETWLPGYPVWLDFSDKAGLWNHPPARSLYSLLVKNSIRLNDHRFNQIQKLAEIHKIHLVVGLHELKGNTLYNSILYFNKNGKDWEVHRKLMPTYTEKLIWGRGDGSTLSVMQTEDLGVIGGLICWEHWMPEARIYMHHQREIIHIAQWPFVKDLHQIASRHYAFEGQCFVATAGCTLNKREMIEGAESASKNLSSPADLSLLYNIPVADEDLVLKGGSGIIAPDTRYLIEPQYGSREMIICEINTGEIIQGHLEMDSTGHYSRPDIFNLEVDTRPQGGVTVLD